MGSMNINNIKTTPLNRIFTKGGDVLHGIKITDAGYVGFGEAYHSLIEINSVKAWKKHAKMTLNLIVPLGHVKFVFTTDGLHYRIEEIGNHNFVRLTVPPGIWFGCKGLFSPTSLILNVADIPHDQSEVEHLGIGQFDFSWF